MLIALHSSHHFLPFWSNPQEPKEFFNPEIHSKLILTLRDGAVPIKENWLWPILDGLHTIDLHVMAHVSAFCECNNDGTKHFAHRVWVQITTLPEGKIGDLPLVVKEKEVLVKSLWGGDNGTYSPLEFLPKDQRKVEHDTAFWKDFFENSLKEAKDCANEEATVALREATDTAHLYRMIPD